MSASLSSSTSVSSGADTSSFQKVNAGLSDWKRLFGFAFGLGAQAFFVLTVVGLFSFLRYGVDAPSESWIVVDTVLALQFVIPHSILLHPRFRTWFRERFPMEMHGAFFCVCTCVSLFLIFAFWKSSPVIVWQFEGASAAVVTGCFFGSWVALLYSISLTGLGFQTGLTQWLYWYRREKMPRRNFEAKGLYHILRHPVYLSFLGLIWFTPTMTADHAVLTGIWTVYIFAGSVLKDQRLKFYLGDTYASYMANVPGYPLMVAGPLARVPLRSSEADATIPMNVLTADNGSERRKAA